MHTILKILRAKHLRMLYLNILGRTLVFCRTPGMEEPLWQCTSSPLLLWLCCCWRCFCSEHRSQGIHSEILHQFLCFMFKTGSSKGLTCLSWTWIWWSWCLCIQNTVMRGAHHHTGQVIGVTRKLAPVRVRGPRVSKSVDVSYDVKDLTIFQLKNQGNIWKICCRGISLALSISQPVSPG